MRWLDYFLQTLAPVWLQDEHGTKWITAFAEEKQALTLRLQQSIALRMPSYCHEGALVLHQEERRIERGAGESATSFRGRLRNAFAIWRWSGTDYGVMRDIEPQGWAITHLDAGDLWPTATWPANAAGETGHVWIVSSRDWLPPPGWEASISAQWLVLDYWSHVGAAAHTHLAVSLFGAAGVGAGTASAAVAEVETTRTVLRNGSAGPVARTRCAAAPIGEDIVVFGGQDSGAADLADTWVWRRDADDWQQANPATSPSARHGHAMAAFNRAVVMWGGRDAGTMAAANKVWTFASGEWTSVTLGFYPDPRDGHAMAVLDGAVYVFGGVDNTGTGRSDTAKWDGSAWTALSPAHHPSARWGHSMVTLGSHIVLFGGYDTSTLLPLNDTWLWDGSDWAMLSPSASPQNRALHGAAAISDTELLVWGGYNGANLSSVWRWDGSNWSGETALPGPHSGGASLGLTVRNVFTPRNAAGSALRGAGPVRGCNMTVGERDTLIASIRKWKGSHATYPEMALIMSPGGFGGCRGIGPTRGGTRPRGGRLIKGAVGEKP